MKQGAFSGFVVVATVAAVVGFGIYTDGGLGASGGLYELTGLTGDHGAGTVGTDAHLDGAPIDDIVHVAAAAVRLQSETLTAAIYEGQCNTLSAESVVDLNDLEPAPDEVDDPVSTVLISDNPRVDSELGDLADGEHSIGVFSGTARSGQLIACGEIGEQDADRNVVVVLRSQQSPGFAGLGLLFDNADEDPATHVLLYIDADLGQDVIDTDGDSPATPIATPHDTTTDAGAATPVVFGTPESHGTPVQNGTPVAGEETPVPIQEEIYESPNYGYTVTYNGAVWSVVEAEAIEDELGEPVDVLHISNGVTNAQFFGRTGTLDAEDCLAGLTEQMEGAAGVTGFESRSGDDGAPLERGDEDDAYALFDYTQESNGEVSDLTVFVRCQVIEEGESLLLTFLTVPTAEFEWEEAVHRELLAGVELP